MTKQLAFFLPALAVLFLFACKPKAVQPKVELTHEMRSFVKNYCVNDQQCANYTVMFPVFSGSDSAVVRAVNQTIQSRIITILNGNQSLPFEVALDSVGINFIEQFIQLKRDVPEQMMNQSIQLTSTILLNNGHVLTVQENLFSSTGGAHPNTATALMSLNLDNKGALLNASDMLKDPAGVLPMLEKAFKRSKGLAEGADISLLLLTPDKKLPLPFNTGIVPEGILFIYSDYEVASHAVGPTNILLTWEQLGEFADKSKWIQ